jgi:hypothetical protein
MLPNSLLLRTYVGRHLRSWALLRVGLSGLFVFSGTDPLRLSPWTVCAVVALSAFVNVVEVQVRRERDLLGNLGVDPVAFSALLIAPPLVGELVLRALGVLRV